MLGAEGALLARFGVVVGVGAVVGGEEGQGTVLQRATEGVVVVRALAGRGRADAFCAGETGLVEVGAREEEVLRAGFGVDGEGGGGKGENVHDEDGERRG